MNAVIEEWRRKAEGDFATACREMAAAVDPNYDAVCFHAQQSIEKLMKALLIAVHEQVPRVHDLVMLGRMLRPHVRDWSIADDDLLFLTRAAVEFRYPGESAEQDDASEAMAICSSLRERLDHLLDAPDLLNLSPS
jgi:HEPN domain-containing protein